MKLQVFLPLVTYSDPNSEAVAANAVAVARLLGAELHAHAFNVELPRVGNALSRFLIDMPEMIRDTEAKSRERGERLVAAVAEQAKAAGIAATSGSESEALPLLGATAAIRARLYDLAVVGLEAENATSRATAESVIFGSGRPVVLLPERFRPEALDHVAVAWDGSRVAARAVADARPFLEKAARVSVLTVLDEKPLAKNTADALVASLLRSGLKAEAVALNGDGKAIAAALQQAAADAGAGLLVMGGYGHSRLRDFVLGGATEGVLGDLRLPALLSH